MDFLNKIEVPFMLLFILFFIINETINIFFYYMCVVHAYSVRMHVTYILFWFKFLDYVNPNKRYLFLYYILYLLFFYFKPPQLIIEILDTKI